VEVVAVVQETVTRAGKHVDRCRGLQACQACGRVVRVQHAVARTQHNEKWCDDCLQIIVGEDRQPVAAGTIAALDQQHVIDDGVGNAAGPKRNPQSTTRPTLTEWHQGQCREDGAVALTADPARGPQRQSFDAAWPADRVIRGQPPAQRHPHEAGDIDAQPIEDVVQPVAAS
jgi:hypothetical protein